MNKKSSKGHNVLLSKIIPNSEILQDWSMVKTLVNVNNYLANNPNIKKEANWSSGGNEYPMLDKKILQYVDSDQISYLNIGAGGGGSFYEDLVLLREVYPNKEIIATNRDVNDFISKELKQKISELNVNYIFQNALEEPLGDFYDITVLKVSLHHIPNPFEVIDSINSTLVVLREANVITKYDLHMQTVEHMLYHMLENTSREIMDYDEMKNMFNEYETNTGRFSNKTDNYFSRNDWFKAFKKNGYKSIANNAVKKYKDVNNPSKLYREVFVKI